MMNKKVILVILDGYGISVNEAVSAVSQAKTPYFDKIWNHYPKSYLEASGLAVGLPEGQFGNSEVGHMNLGAGRIVFQDLVKINKSIADKELQQNALLVDKMKAAKAKGKKVHFIGLVSNGGVHSHITHLKALIDAAHLQDIDNLYIHAFTDGRDCGPQTGKGFLGELSDYLLDKTGQLATITGRYYAMDRDNRWERVSKAYHAMVHGEGLESTDPLQAIQDSYDKDITDEFIDPIIVNKNGLIEEGDTVVCFNYRTDRGREITKVLTQEAFPEYRMKPLDLTYVTMTTYDESFKGVDVIFRKDNLKNTLGEWLEKQGKKQIRIAETEKYPHVTFFFSGGRESEFKGEKRLLCPSPKVATYDLKPEMSAFDICDKIVPEIQNETADFICLNCANPDMVGHTGVMEAAIKACETVDTCLETVAEEGLKHGYTSFVIADHGNADIMVNPDGSPYTAHTTALVPFVVVDNDYKGEAKDGKLGDLAPTILKTMGLPIPEEMTGDYLTD